MWYINNSKTNHVVDSSFYKFAQKPQEIWNAPWPKREYKRDYSDLSKIKQIDETYFGVYDINGRLIAVMPVYFGGNGVNDPGVKLNPSLIRGLKINDDNYEFSYPDSNGQPRQYSASLDQQSILPRYLKQQLDEMGLRTDTRGGFERIKNEEKLQGQLYREMIQLAGQLFAKYQNLEQVKKDLQYRIFDLFQNGQISEQMGNTLYAWMVQYVIPKNFNATEQGRPKTLDDEINKTIKQYPGTTAQRIPGGFFVNLVIHKAYNAGGKPFQAGFNVRNNAELQNKISEFVAYANYSPQQKQEIQTQNNNALPQSNEQIEPEPYKWPRDKPEFDLTKRK